MDGEVLGVGVIDIGGAAHVTQAKSLYLTGGMSYKQALNGSSRQGRVDSKQGVEWVGWGLQFCEV